MMNNIRAICFDLDDTLWDLRPVIPRAERRLYRWFEQHYPRVSERYSPDQMRQMRQGALAQWPELRHDLTELRIRVLQQIASATGYDAAMVEGAYDVFFAARNDVTVYADVVPVLSRLAANYSLFALSNGNADLKTIGIAHHFDAAFGARELGVAKPDSHFFVAAASRCGMATEEIMHVGDHPQNDVVAARKTGMTTVWINRENRDWPAVELRPDHEIAGLTELLGLLEQ